MEKIKEEENLKKVATFLYIDNQKDYLRMYLPFGSVIVVCSLVVV